MNSYTTREGQAALKLRLRRPSNLYARRPRTNHSWKIPGAWRAMWALRGYYRPRLFRRIARGFEWDYIVSVEDAHGQEWRARIAADALPETARTMVFQRRAELGWPAGLIEV